MTADADADYPLRFDVALAPLPKLKRSFVIFTMHKAGSMVLHQVVKDICDLKKIHPFSEHDAEPNKLPVRKIFARENYIARRNGCFGPVRFYLPAPG